MKRRKIGIILILSILVLTSCASIRDKIAVTKGQLIGTKFDVSCYDHQGEKTLTISGKKVGVEVLKENPTGEEEEAKYPNSVLEITINGKQMLQVGNTLIFAENGLDMVENFELPETVDVKKGGSLIAIDRNINHIKNKLGKEKTIIISTPKGVPIGIYQGKKVYATVPRDLPKMTRLNIDGKSLYIHRANYMILDTDMIN